MFRDGQGENGELPPNNWESVFGGAAWTRVTEPDGTPGQWYLHLFDSSQPDLNWDDPWVREQFRGILRFWLDRGVDGFRVDVAHGMVKKPGLPDYTPAEGTGSMGGGARPPSSRPSAPSCPTCRRTGARTACTTSTATGASCSTPTRASASWRPRRGSTRSLEWPTGFARTRCTRPSTSPTSRRRGTLRHCAPSSTSRSRRSPPSGHRRPGCCPTTTWCATRRASR